MLIKNSRRDILSALGLVLSSTVFSPVASAVCDGSALCAMENRGGFYVSATGAYVRPSESGLGLATGSWQYNGDNGSIVSRGDPIDTDHDWAGGLKLGYDFCGSANTLELSYFHLDTSNSAYHDLADNPISFGSIFFPNVFFDLPLPGFATEPHLVYELNQVTFLAKHGFEEKCGQFTLTPMLGLRWAELEHDYRFDTGHVYSKFNGFGPVFGLDGSWGFMKCFSLVGRFDYSPIIGKIRSNSRRIDSDGESYFTSPKADRIVHNLNAKLGVDYTYTFCDQQQATFELGWQASQYLNATDILRGNYRVNSGNPNIPLVVQRILGIESNTFSFQGPYLEAMWHF